MAAGRKSGFTLIELLVVVGVISILGSMLLPAIQAAREAARLNSCRNHVAQLAKGLVAHESHLGYFPSGGWGPTWLGVSERSSDSSQPGGWIYSVLPYIEEKDLRNVVAGVSGASAGSAYAKLANTSVPVLSCPSRRPSRSMYVPEAMRSMKGAGDSTMTITTAIRADYAINGGSSGACVAMASYRDIMKTLTASSLNSKKVTLCHKGHTQSIGLPAASAPGHADDMLGACESCSQPFTAANMRTFLSLSSGDQWRKLSLKEKILTDQNDLGIPDMQNGICFRMSRVQAAGVFDGLSNTYLLGEKYVTPGTYDLGTADGDGRPMMAGYSHDTVRWAIDPPEADARGETHSMVFGSGHRAGWNVAYADGMVRTMSFDVDLETHRRLSNRDGISRGEMAGIPPP